MPKNILITGFEPFGGEAINPSLEAVMALPGEIDGTKVTKMSLPVVFDKSADVLFEALKNASYDAIVSVGQAGGTSKITIERIAINIDDTKSPDNDGNSPIDQQIAQGAPVAYFATLPIKKILQNLIDQKIPATISNTAGTYVCNHIMYQVLHHIAQNNLKIQSGFIHIPYLPEQTLEKPANTPSMPLENIIAALKIIIQSI